MKTKLTLQLVITVTLSMGFCLTFQASPLNAANKCGVVMVNHSGPEFYPAGSRWVNLSLGARRESGSHEGARTQAHRPCRQAV